MLEFIGGVVVGGAVMAVAAHLKLSAVQADLTALGASLKADLASIEAKLKGSTAVPASK